MAETGQPYAFTGDDPLNATDPLGIMATNQFGEGCGQTIHNCDETSAQEYSEDPDDLSPNQFAMKVACAFGSCPTKNPVKQLIAGATCAETASVSSCKANGGNASAAALGDVLKAVVASGDYGGICVQAVLMLCRETTAGGHTYTVIGVGLGAGAQVIRGKILGSNVTECERESYMQGLSISAGASLGLGGQDQYGLPGHITNAFGEEETFGYQSNWGASISYGIGPSC